MDNLILKCFCTTLFSLSLLSSFHSVSSSSSSSSSTDQIHLHNPPSSVPINPTHYQVFHLKNTNPTLQERFKKTKTNRKKKVKKQRKKMMIKSNPFSVMLPKGFVPPSGSSPCHNQIPTSLSFHCHVSNSQP